MLKNYISDLKKEFRGYNGGALAQDAMAGLTVCAVALPLALAFGVSGGASAAAGMVTAIVAGIVISILSGASFQISGPTGAMSAVLVAIVTQYGLQGMFLASLISGILLLVCGVLKLGRFIGFIPSPVVMGFTSGIALVIALGQVDNFFGTHSEGTGAVEKLFSYFRLGFKPDIAAVGIGLLVMAVMILWPKKWNTRVPSSLVSIIVAAIISALLKLDGLATVGDIPKTLFLANRLDIAKIDLSVIPRLISPIITIAALGMIESLMCGASASRMKGERFDADRELIAQGIGNVLLPFFGGVPATAAIARSSVAIKSGQRTRMTGVFHALFLLAAMFLLSPVMAKLPLSTLAGVLMMTAWRMNDWKEIGYIFKNRFKAAISQFLITLVATVYFDLLIAILIGILYSALLFAVSCCKLKVHFEKDSEEKIRAKINGAIFFGSVDEIRKAFSELPKCTELFISLRGVSEVDISGAKAVLELVNNLSKKGISVSFYHVSKSVKAFLSKAGVEQSLFCE